MKGAGGLQSSASQSSFLVQDTKFALSPKGSGTTNPNQT
jgi:hypothetical protein